MSKHKDLHKIVKKVLDGRTHVRIQDRDSSYMHASVLIPLFQDDGEYRILFTKRTSRVEHHKGQISFPGGAVDKQDTSLKETALREAHEEIGLSREDVDILGRLDDALTVVSNFLIHPFVGYIPCPYDFRLNAREVDRLIQVPLSAFLGDDPSIKKESVEIEGVTYYTPAYLYHGDVIWGATARIMENFAHILGKKLDLPEEVQ